MEHRKEMFWYMEDRERRSNIHPVRILKEVAENVEKMK